MKITPKWSSKQTKYGQKARKNIRGFIYRKIFFVEMTEVAILVEIAETNGSILLIKNDRDNDDNSENRNHSYR